MRVLILCDVQRKGGAGIAAHRLASALTLYGHEVHWATPYPTSSCDITTHNCREYSTGARVIHKALNMLQPARRQTFESHAIVRRLKQIVSDIKPDVVNVHNLHGASLPATLPAELSQIVPVVWTLHDMWAFTGTCAYSMGCRKFESYCDSHCPMADEYPSSPASQVGYLYEQRKKALAEAGRLAFATPSQWLADEAVKGMLNGFDVRAIPNCIELDQFVPVDKDAARQGLNLPLGRPVLVTTATPGDPRKGASVLYEAMKLLGRPNTIMLQLGGDYKNGVEHWDHRVLEGVDDPRLMRIVYSAADAHILPTLADNLPNTLLEAAACGVPSIASDVGGVGEAIINSETGWLVPPSDADALAQKIGVAIDLNVKHNQAIRTRCRAFAEAQFAPAIQAKRYTELFEQTINQDLAQNDILTQISSMSGEAA